MAAVTHVAAHLGRRAQDGYTPLMLAAMNGRNADCARLLLDAGADKSCKRPVRASADAPHLRLGQLILIIWGILIFNFFISRVRVYPLRMAKQRWTLPSNMEKRTLRN